MADNGSSGSKLTPSRPNVAVDGKDSSSLAEGLLELRIHESSDGLFTCEATFGNWGNKDGQVTFLYFDRQAFDFGKELRISLGTEPIFQGRITGLEGRFPEGKPPAITVLAEDRHQDLRMVRRTRTFTDVSDADAMRQIATEAGLTPDVNLPGPKHPVLAQLNQSDLAFLRERARTVDAELWMDGSTLAARSRSDRTGPSVRLGYGHELREFTVLADLAGQRTSLKVSGWDVAGKQAISEEADDSVIGAELAGGKSGATVLSTALAKRKEAVVHLVPFTGQEARARAETLFKRMARRFLTAHGVAETSAKLKVGAKIKLEHLGDLFDGEYYLSEVTHLFDGELGLRTAFAAERTGLGGTA